MKANIDLRDHLKPGSRECQCSACRKYFTSPTAFDLHRENGQCLTVPQMVRKGMRRDDRLRWTTGRINVDPAAG